MKQMYGRKVGMTQIYTEKGECVPVTVIEMTPNVVVQVKSSETKDGYNAIQIGLEPQKPQRVNRAQTNHFAKAQKGAFKVTKEIRLHTKTQKRSRQEVADLKAGDELKVDGLFEAGHLVDVTGVTIGKGFAGVMKRHGMKGYPMTRGTHEYRRHAGSIGCRKFPGRTFKNKRMGGHMGVDRVTQLNLEVIQVRPEENLLMVRGSVPGNKNTWVLVRTAVRTLNENA